CALQRLYLTEHCSGLPLDSRLRGNDGFGRNSTSTSSSPRRRGSRRGQDTTTSDGETAFFMARSPLVVAHLVGADLSANFAANRNAAQPLPQKQDCAANT